MSKQIKVLIACGSGIATSTYAESAVREIADAKNYSVKISKCSMQEVEEKSKAFDIAVFTSNNWKRTIPRENIRCRAVSGASLLTGIGKDKTVEEIENHFREISKS